MKMTCQSCGWVGSDADDGAEFVEDTLDRHGPDDIVADGQCPECGALCYRDDRESRWVARSDLLDLARLIINDPVAAYREAAITLKLQEPPE